MANHARARTTQLYDRRHDEMSPSLTAADAGARVANKEHLARAATSGCQLVCPLGVATTIECSFVKKLYAPTRKIYATLAAAGIRRRFRIERTLNLHVSSPPLTNQNWHDSCFEALEALDEHYAALTAPWSWKGAFVWRSR